MGKVKRAHHVWGHQMNRWARPVGLCPSCHKKVKWPNAFILRVSWTHLSVSFFYDEKSSDDSDKCARNQFTVLWQIESGGSLTG